MIMLCRFLNGLENWKDYMESEVKQMSIERVTAERALEHLKAGHSIIILQAADMTSLTIADWLTSDLAVEVPDEHPVDENSQAGGGKTSTTGGRKKLDWGKIKALHDAGWSHAKIADEMGCTVATVDTGLSKMRKGGKSSGKEQGGKANVGVEEDHV